jgi:hypothetical protein
MQICYGGVRKGRMMKTIDIKEEKKNKKDIFAHIPVVDLTGVKKKDDYPSDVREWLDDPADDIYWQLYKKGVKGF